MANTCVYIDCPYPDRIIEPGQPYGNVNDTSFRMHLECIQEARRLTEEKE